MDLEGGREFRSGAIGAPLFEYAWWMAGWNVSGYKASQIAKDDTGRDRGVIRVVIGRKAVVE